jgi:hypothetical protein
VQCLPFNRQGQTLTLSIFAVPRLPELCEYWRQRGIQAFLLDDDRGVAFQAFKSHLHSWKNPPKSCPAC